jgi:hypothetical protein
MHKSPKEKENHTAALQSLEMQKAAMALILAKLTDDLSVEVDIDAFKTTYVLFLRDEREKMGLIGHY